MPGRVCVATNSEERFSASCRLKPQADFSKHRGRPMARAAAVGIFTAGVAIGILLASNLFVEQGIKQECSTTAIPTTTSPAPKASTLCDVRDFAWSASVANMKAVLLNGITDKAHPHEYQYLYHQYFTKLVHQKCQGRNAADLTVRILEIGLGCGMQHGPGGGAMFYNAVFTKPLKLEYHVLEYDRKCLEKWDAANPGVAHVHHGSQASAEDLDRVVREAGSRPFDIIVDDGPHVNDFQIFTLLHMIKHLVPRGLYILEDTHSACFHWGVNSPDSVPTGGIDDPRTWYSTRKVQPQCINQTSGKPTIFSRIIGWQKELLLHGTPKELPAVHHIDNFMEATVFEVAEA